MIEANFCDIFTDFTCSNLFCELTKFILYYKQQIPFTYEQLNYAVKKYKQGDDRRKTEYSQSERLYRTAKKNLNILETIFENTAKTFSSNNFIIYEVAFIFGGSILTPKQIYRFHLPIMELGHFPRNHPRNVIMSEILSVIINSKELNIMLSKPLEPTNMFLLLRMGGELNTEKWLIPKPRYKIPSIGQQINLNFKFESAANVPCLCKGISFFCDDSSYSCSHIPAAAAVNDESRVVNWYQAPLVFSGFKDVFVGGVSVSKQWLTAANDMQS